LIYKKQIDKKWYYKEVFTLLSFFKIKEKIMLNNSFYLCVFILLSLPTRANNSQWVEWIAAAQVSVTNIDNLNISAFNNDKVADNRLAISTSFGRFYQISSTSRFHLALDLSTDKHRDTELLDETAYGINIGFRHKFGVGFKVPYMQIGLNSTSHDVKADSWSRNISNASFELGQHFSERLSLAAKLNYSSSNGSSGPIVIEDISGNPFDQNHWQATVYVDYMLEQNWLLTLNLGYRDGDILSACDKNNVDIVWEKENITAITKDDIFGGCVYSLKASAVMYGANISYALSNHTALDLAINAYSGQADVLDYKGKNLMLVFNYSY